jgi:glutaredoxin
VCKYCNLSKEFFKKHNIEYTEHNVAADAERRAEMIDISGQMGVPVIQIDDMVVVGYNEKAFHELLGV